MGRGLSRVRQGAEYRAAGELHEQKGYPVRTLCEILGLNRSSYYKWLTSGPSESELRDRDLVERIRFLYQESNGIFGYRRMRLNLRRRFGLGVNKKRVYRILRAIGLQSVIRRKRPCYAGAAPEVTAANILGRKFTSARLNEKRLSDVTEFKCMNGEKLCLSAILDLRDKGVVSYCLGPRSTNKLVFDTFGAAVRRYPGAHPLFHSDRGFQYTSKPFRAKLDAQRMTQSMARAGRCIDNGPMEAFWGTLKSEMYYLRTFHDSASLRLAIEEYIEFCNTRRFQERLGGLAPQEYRALPETAA